MDLLIARIVLALAVLLALPNSAAAGSVLRLGLEQVVAGSELIVRGRVEARSCERVDGGLIVTRIALRVDEALRGARAGDRLVFRVPGGEVGDSGLIIPGMPTFAVGEDVLLFLTARTSLGVRVPVGLGQGVLRLRRDLDGGRLRVERDLGDLELLDPDGAVAAGPVPLASDALAELLPALARLVATDDQRREAEAEAGAEAEAEAETGGRR